MPARPLVAQLVTTHLAPLLKQHGWRKKALTFERRIGDTTQVINVQVSSGGASFYVNVGIVIDAVEELGGDDTRQVFGPHTVTHGERLDGWMRGVPKVFSVQSPDTVGPPLRDALEALMPTLDSLDSPAALRERLDLRKGFNKILRAQLAWLAGDTDAARADVAAVASEFADRHGVSFAQLARRAGMKGLKP